MPKSLSAAAPTDRSLANGPPGPGKWVLAAIFAFPLLGGLAIRAAIGGIWPRDLDAVTCAAWRAAHQVSPYSQGHACPIGRPAGYMYLPQLASLLAPLTHGAWAVALRGGLALLILAAAAFLIWVLVLRPLPGAPRLLRASVLALTTGGALAIGNLALICHALVLGAGLARRRSPGPLIATIILVSLLKPVLLTYLLIFAYERQPIAVRAARIGSGAALAALAGLLVLATAGPWLGDWRAALDQVALRAQPGYGFLGWMGELGMNASNPFVLLAFLVFAAAACLSGLAVAEVRKLAPEQRLFLALAVAQIVNPRPMTYDLIMLTPLVLAFTTEAAGPRRIFRWGLYGLGLAEVALFLAGADLAQRLGPAALTLALLAAGGLAARDGLAARAFGSSTQRVG